MGSVFIALSILPFVFMMVFAARPFSRHKSIVEKTRHKLKKLFIWDGVLAIINENYMLILISVAVNFTFYSNHNTKGKILSLSTAGLFVIIIIGYPLFVLIFLLKRYDRLSSYIYRVKLGTLYDKFRYKENKWQVMEPFISAVRRIIMVAAMVFLWEWPMF